MTAPASPGAPLVSVVIPAYRAAATISETLESVFAQDYPKVEIVVVDDGSTDDTRAVLDRFGDRVRTISKPNGGLASARNVGVRAARGEIIAVLDADDLCTPDRLSLQVRVFNQFPDVVLSATEFSAFNETGTFSAAFGSEYYSRIGGTEGGISALLPRREDIALDGGGVLTTHRGDGYDPLVFGNFLHPPTLAFRREIFERVGPFDESLRFTSDWEWLVRAARLGPFAFLDRALLRYRISQGQMSNPTNRAVTAHEILVVLEKCCDSDPALLRRHSAEIRRTLHDFSVEAAEAQVDTDRRKARKLLVRSARYGLPNKQALRVSAKLLIPNAVILGVRRLKAKLR